MTSLNFIRMKLFRDHCSTVFSSIYHYYSKPALKNRFKELNHIYGEKKPLSVLSTIRTVLQSTVRIVVVVVVVVVVTGGIFNVSP